MLFVLVVGELLAWDGASVSLTCARALGGATSVFLAASSELVSERPHWRMLHSVFVVVARRVFVRGWLFGLGVWVAGLHIYMCMHMSVHQQPAISDVMPASKSITNITTALALWTRTKGVCCWLLAGQDTAESDASNSYTSSTSDTSKSSELGATSAACFLEKARDILKSAVERRDALLCASAVALVGNLLACRGCWCLIQQHLQADLVHELVAVPGVFPHNAMVGRMVARALHYYFEHGEVEEAVNFASARAARRAGSRKWQMDEIIKSETALRRKRRAPLVNNGMHAAATREDRRSR